MDASERLDDSGGLEEHASRDEYHIYYVNQSYINPFHNKSHAEMRSLIQKFIQTTQIDSDWHSYFKRAALLAQDPTAYGKSFEEASHNGEYLNPSEIAALCAEASNHWLQKWKQPITLYALVACCSLGAATQGWDETAINQAQLFFKKRLKLEAVSDLLGLVVSAPYLSAAVLGCFLSDPMNRFLGRRGTLFFACFISCASCVLQSFTQNWIQLFLARLLLGFGIGPKSVTAPIYASECAPKNIRGGLVMMWQMWTAFGIMAGFVAGVVFGSIGSDTNDHDVDLRWRLIIGSPMLLPIVVCAYIYCLPESPRWLLGKGQSSKTGGEKYYGKAIESLHRLRQTKLQAARDMFLIYHQLQNEHDLKEERSRFFELWEVPRNRRALMASIICTFFQQFCGINVLAYYSGIVFQSAGYTFTPNTPYQSPTQQRALLASLGFGILNFVFAIPAIYLIDTFGRRALLLTTFPLMALFHLLTGISFQFHETAKTVLVTLFMYLFSIAYSPGEGPVPYVYSAESMPLYVRTLGMSIAIAINWLFTFVLAITFPPFWKHLTPTGTFCYYAAWCVAGFFLILFFVPETKGRTLEELDAVFSIPTRIHARHGLRQLKYYGRWGLTFRKPDGPKPRLPVRYEKPEKKEKEPPREIDFSQINLQQ